MLDMVAMVLTRRATVAVLAMSSVAMSTVALAADDGHGGGGSSPFAGDLGNAIWTLVIFGLVLFVLGKFVWPQILSALQKREEFIFESLASAKKDRESAAAQLKEYERKLEESRAEASAIVEEARRDATVVTQRELQKANEEAETLLARAKRDISVARDTAVKELYTLSANLATDVAGRIIKKELNAAEHETLVQDAIKSLGLLEASNN
jgi:F-type H+-transporting ATPase subunit b